MNNTVSFPKCLTSFHLKVIAIVSMLIDHFAYIFFASVLSASYMVQNGTVVYADFRKAFLLWVAENHTILWNINDIMHWIGRLAFPLFCFLLVAMYNQQRGPRIKYFFYAFYPVHLLLLAFMAVWIGNLTIFMGDMK